MLSTPAFLLKSLCVFALFMFLLPHVSMSQCRPGERPIRFSLPSERFCENITARRFFSVGAEPFGGIYSGPGVEDLGNGRSFFFDPKEAGAGIKEITYTLTRPDEWNESRSIPNVGGTESQFGHALAFSGDGQILAVGMPVSTQGRGEVRVFRRVGDEWIPLGSSILGEEEGDNFGESVAISVEGNILAVGAPGNDGAGAEAGHVRVFQLAEEEWIQVGQDMDGENEGDGSGTSLALSGNGLTVAIGAPGNDGAGLGAGHVRIFQREGDAWIQQGQDIDGTEGGDRLGRSVSLSNDGRVVAIGAYGVSGGNAHVQILQLNGDSWQQIGSDLTGFGSDDRFGFSLSLSGGGERIVIGAPTGELSGNIFERFSGYAAVFEFNGIRWVSMGIPLQGEPEDRLGHAVSMNSAGDKIVIGAPPTDERGSGYISIYHLVDRQWEEIGGPIRIREIGFSVSISPEGNRIASAGPSMVINSSQSQALNSNITLLDLNPACTESAREFLEVLPREDASFSFPNSVCLGNSQNPRPIILGDEGGRFSVDLGASINRATGELDLSSTQAGRTYRITYQTPGPCPEFQTRMLTVQSPPEIRFQGPEDLCIAEGVQEGLGGGFPKGGVYRGPGVIDGGDGLSYSFDPALSGSGLHQLTYSFPLGWRPIGQSLEGLNPGDLLGNAISMSEDGQCIAVGEMGFDGNGNNAGRVRVFKWSGSAWVQRGLEIPGEVNQDQAGFSLDLSADGSRLAIGAIGHDANGDESGQVRIYEWLGFGWRQVGQDLLGEEAGDLSGFSLTLSADGNIIGIGSVSHEGRGQLRIFEFDQTQWNQIGEDIEGNAFGEQFGFSLDFSEDGDRIAVGTKDEFRGRAYVYELRRSNWVLLGERIITNALSDHFGHAVSLSANGTRLAIGAPFNDENGTHSGKVVLFELAGDSWNSIGEISGESIGDQFGMAVSLSSDGHRVAVGADRNAQGGDFSGHVRVFERDGPTGNWNQIGEDIEGIAPGGLSGNSLAFSINGQRLAVGAIGVNENAGQVQVYDFFDGCIIAASDSIQVFSSSSAAFSFPASLCLEDSVSPLPLLLGAEEGTFSIDKEAVVDPQRGELDLSSLIPGESYLLSYSIPGNCPSISSHVFEVLSPPEPGFLPQLQICFTEDTLGGIPLGLENPGGVFSGPGIIDGGDGITFDFAPSAVGVGSYKGIYSLPERHDWNRIGSFSEEDAFLSDNMQVLAYSADGKRMAAKILGNGSSILKDEIRVFELQNSEWIQLGSPVMAESFSDAWGQHLTLSADGNRLAFTAPFHRVNVFENTVGQVFVFEWTGKDWKQLGPTFQAIRPGDILGLSMALSANGKRLAIQNATSRLEEFFMRIFEWDGMQWQQLGDSILGNVNLSISISAEGDRIATGSIDPFGIPEVQVHLWTGREWVQEGENLMRQGFSEVRLSAKGERLVVQDENGLLILERAGEEWIPTEEGIALNEGESMFSLDLSSSGHALALGLRSRNGAKLIRTYQLSGRTWEQTAELFPELASNSDVISIDVSGNGERLLAGFGRGTVSAFLGSLDKVQAFELNRTCPSLDSVFIEVNPLPNPEISGLDAYCTGTDGVTLEAKEGFESYFWSTGETGQAIQALVGAYTVRVRNEFSCDATSDSFFVKENPLPSASISTSAKGYCEGAAGVELTAGPDNASFLWSNGDTTQVTLAQKGLISVTITDSNGCMDTTEEFEIQEFPNPTPIILGDSTYCPGDPGVILSVDSSFADYEWSPNGEGSERIEALAGIYSVEVFDALGCRGSSEDFVVSEIPLPELIFEIEPATCVEAGRIILLNYTREFPGILEYLAEGRLRFSPLEYEEGIAGRGFIPLQEGPQGAQSFIVRAILDDCDMVESILIDSLSCELPCEPSNQALNKPTRMICAYGTSSSDLGVDGVVDGITPWTDNPDLVHSCPDLTDPWWEVDLGNGVADSLFEISEICIYNRITGGEEVQGRLSGYYLFISCQPFREETSLEELIADESIYKVLVEETAGFPTCIPIPEVVGQYVRIQLPGDLPLHFGELEVYACPAPGVDCSPEIQVENDARTQFAESLFNPIRGRGFSLSAYPNPFSKEIRVEVAGEFSSAAKIQIVNTLGQVLEQKVIGQGRYFSLGKNYAKGIYIVQVLDGAYVEQVKIVKTE